MPSGPLAARWFRVIATFEAISWTALLVAMFLKWIVKAPHEGGVPVVGMIHGVGFVIYLISTVWASVRLRWTRRTTLVGLVAGIPPFGTIVFERRLVRQGLLTTRSGRGSDAVGSPSRG